MASDLNFFICSTPADNIFKEDMCLQKHTNPNIVLGLNQIVKYNRFAIVSQVNAFWLAYCVENLDWACYC